MCIYDNRGQNSSKLVAGVVLGRCLAMLLRRRCRSSIGHLIRPEGRRPRSSPASEPAARARAKILDHWIGAAGSCGALHLEMPHGDGAAQHAGRSATAAKHHGAGAESAGNMPRRARAGKWPLPRIMFYPALGGCSYGKANPESPSDAIIAWAAAGVPTECG